MEEDLPTPAREKTIEELIHEVPTADSILTFRRLKLKSKDPVRMMKLRRSFVINLKRYVDNALAIESFNPDSPITVPINITLLNDVEERRWVLDTCRGLGYDATLGAPLQRTVILAIPLERRKPKTTSEEVE